LQIYQETFRVGIKQSEKAEREVHVSTQSREPNPKDRAEEESRRKEDNRRYFDPVKTKLIKALQGQLHIPELADRFGAPLKPRKPNPRFGLNLTPEEIVIREI
jgi:hypothetical protein